MNMAQQGQKIAGKLQLMAGWEQKETGAPCRIKAIIDYLTALSYWVGKSI